MRTLIAFLLFALPAQAQYVQGGSVNAAPDTIGGDWTAKSSYSYTFPKPLTSPCTIMVSIRGPEQSVSDSQGNSFILATGNPGRSDRLFYSTTCGSGADTVTVSCPSACWAQFTVSEYAGVWVPDQLSPEVLNVTGVDGYTAPVTPTQDGELILVIGNNHTTNSPGITGGNGFTVRANANQFIGDMLQAKAAPVYGEVTYATPVLWCQRTISFKRTDTLPPPQPDSITASAQLLWCAKCDGSDNVPAVGNLLISQTGAGQFYTPIAPDGTVKALGTIDLSPNPIEFTLSLTDANGATQAGAALTLTFPKFELSSALFTIRNISLGIVRIAHTVDDAGNPAVRIVDVSSFSLAK